MSIAEQTLPEPSSAAYRRGVVLVVMAGVFWSSQGLAIRLMESADAWQILFYRSIALSVFLFAVIAFRSRGKPLAAFRALGPGAMLGGVCLVFAFAGGIFAVKETTVANAFFIFASAPFFTAILSRLILGETVRKTTWVAIFVAGTGIFIMVANQIGGGGLAGNIAALISALGFALFTIVLRWKRLANTLPIVFYGGVFAAVAAGAICLFGGGGFAVPRPDLALSFGMGIGQVGLGLVVFTLGSRHVPAGELTLLSMAEVVLAPTWVYLALGETMSQYTAIGGVLIAAAIVANAVSGMRRKPPPLAIP